MRNGIRQVESRPGTCSRPGLESASNGTARTSPVSSRHLSELLLSSTLRLTFVASELFYTPGTHRGHVNLFLTALGTPSSAFRFLWFLTFTIWLPTFTAMTRVQIPSGTPTFQTAWFRKSSAY